MNIAIHAADLDHSRIDGTRVYLFNLLKKFGAIDKKNNFLIYHKNSFNDQLTPPVFSNYLAKKIKLPFFWTQTRFALEIWRDKPDVLWMPIQNVPILRRKNLRIVVTIHDLAFKIFPQHFTKKDLFKLNRLADIAIKKSDHIIAISEATKNDILKFYPKIDEEKISVVLNGFDKELFEKKVSQVVSENLLKSYNLKAKSYLLYVGAIQPRKNLEVLIEAFEKIKKKNSNDLKLVFAGAQAWKSESTLRKISQSSFREDIIVTGKLPFKDVPAIYQNALIFIYPSLYEGFGIPILEAMASGVPVITAKNSSLSEAGGDAALYFETENSSNLAEKIEQIIGEDIFKEEMIKKGLKHCQSFSWEKCAQETLEILLKKA